MKILNLLNTPPKLFYYLYVSRFVVKSWIKRGEKNTRINLLSLYDTQFKNYEPFVVGEKK